MTKRDEARWLLHHLEEYLGCEFELVSTAECPLGLRVRHRDRTSEGAREVINRQIFLHREEIASLLQERAEDPGGEARGRRSQTGNGLSETGGG